jgi:UDP-glucose 4-epimerase
MTSLRVAVTGGAGRLGVSVVEDLVAAGHDVVCVDRARSPRVHARQVVADLTDAGQAWSTLSAVRAQALVHLAAIAVPFTAPEHVIFRTNVMMAYQALEAAIAGGVTRVLVASSPTVLGYGAPFGWTPTSLPLVETEPIRPWNAYAQSKATIESIVAMFLAQTGDRVRFGTFRPMYVISPEEWRGAPTQQGHTVAERLRSPDLAAVSLFNYVDARDCARFVRTWLEAAPATPNGETFFVGADDALCVDPVPQAVASSLPALAGQAAGLGETQALFSVAKADRVLGWRPVHRWRTELDGATELQAPNRGLPGATEGTAQ